MKISQILPPAPGTNGDSSANKTCVTDHILTTAGQRRRRDMLRDIDDFYTIQAETSRPIITCNIPRGAPPYVYFIQAGVGPIKIGLTVNPEVRLSGLQTANSEVLRLVAAQLGGRRLEMDYHNQFKAYHIRGEWFTPHPDILAEIGRLNRDTAA